jgi:hypothetical protein
VDRAIDDHPVERRTSDDHHAGRTHGASVAREMH